MFRHTFIIYYMLNLLSFHFFPIPAINSMYDTCYCLHPKKEYLTPVNRRYTSKNTPNSFVDNPHYFFCMKMI